MKNLKNELKKSNLVNLLMKFLKDVKNYRLNKKGEKINDSTDK
jgi:hypothetical protein